MHVRRRCLVGEPWRRHACCAKNGCYRNDDGRVPRTADSRTTYGVQANGSAALCRRCLPRRWRLTPPETPFFVNGARPTLCVRQFIASTGNLVGNFQINYLDLYVFETRWIANRLSTVKSRGPKSDLTQACLRVVKWKYRRVLFARQWSTLFVLAQLLYWFGIVVCLAPLFRVFTRSDTP